MSQQRNLNQMPSPKPVDHHQILAQQMRNSPLFTCFTVTVTENSGKTTLSSNFVFSELKIGVESRGIPIETRRVEMGCTPAWDPLFSTRKHKINAKCHFSTVFRNVTVKQVNIVLFLTFSGHEVHNSQSLMALKVLHRGGGCPLPPIESISIFVQSF